jgi:plasmid maintenance system antidote protein VapI
MDMENIVDDQGTTQEQAQKMLEDFCNKGFNGEIGKAALVLGRPTEEIKNFLDGEETIDDDLAMKIRGIAQERGIDIE